MKTNLKSYLNKSLTTFILLYTTITFSQPFTYKIHKNNRVVSLLMSNTQFNQWTGNDEFADRVKSQLLIKDVLKNVNDDFDFITLILNTDQTPTGITYAGKLSSISNAIEGIGVRTFDNTSAYGSNGRLKSIIQLTQKNNILFGPFLHELMHNWASYGLDTVGPRRGFSDDPNDFGSFFGHWGFTGGNTPGQLGGFTQSSLISNGSNSYTVDVFGDFANGGNSVPYTQLELYLMGMIPVEEVEAFDLFQDITSYSRGTKQGTYDFKANTRITYTPDALINKLGKRNPTHLNAQKEFKILTVVITTTPLTDSEWTKFDNDIESFTRKGDDGNPSLYNFWEATRGIGSLNPILTEKSTILNVNDITLTTNNFKVYPIPANQYLTLQNIGRKTLANKLIICNAIGKKIAKLPLEKTTSQTIDVSKYTSGIYYLLFQKGTTILETQKIIIN